VELTGTVAKSLFERTVDKSNKEKKLNDFGLILKNSSLHRGLSAKKNVCKR
jgi:hypothetical protein